MQRNDGPQLILKNRNGRVGLRRWVHHDPARLLVQDVYNAHDFLLPITIGYINIFQETVVSVVLGPASRDPSPLEVITKVPGVALARVFFAREGEWQKGKRVPVSTKDSSLVPIGSKKKHRIFLPMQGWLWLHFKGRLSEGSWTVIEGYVI